MAVPYILAQSFEESHRFAREELGLGKGHYYVVTSPAVVKGIHGADLYMVPGWEKRYDRFKMASALRWTRLNKIDVAEMRAQAEEPAAEPDDLEPRGEQTVLVDATEFFVAPEDTAETPEESAEEPKRRRRRCKECGVLVEPDEMESHAAEHLPVEV